MISASKQLDTNNMQVQIRVIKLYASGCKMISTGVGKVCSPLGLVGGRASAFACQTIREEKFHSALITVMKSIAQLFSFAFLKALCLGGGREQQVIARNLFF